MGHPQLSAILPPPDPKDVGFVERFAEAETRVRAQYASMMQTDETKRAEVTKARLQLEAWCGYAKPYIYDPITRRMVDWAKEADKEVWERVFPQLVACCYNYLSATATVGGVPLSSMRAATKAEALLNSQCTPCPVPMSALSPAMLKKYGREAPILQKKVLGNASEFSLELGQFRAEWTALFRALPSMHWSPYSFITARLVWDMLPETHRMRLSIIPWVKEMANNNWSELEEVKPQKAVMLWYTAILEHHCLLRLHLLRVGGGEAAEGSDAPGSQCTRASLPSAASPPPTRTSCCWPSP